MKGPSVAIYVIAKNEAERIGRMLKSVQDADEIVVLDTGSDDDTAVIAQDMGATVHHALFKPWRYDDARNMALASVSGTIDLCQRIDCDEEMCPNWREKIADFCTPTKGVNRYSYPQINHAGRWGKNMRNDLHQRWGFRWRYPTHEALEGPGGPEPQIPEYWVDHHPDKGKPRYNIEILRNESTRDPCDTRMAFYYARELYYAGQYEACRPAMMRFVAMEHAWSTEVGEAWRIMAAIDTYPERWLWKAIAADPLRREPYCDLARAYHAKGQLLEARAVAAVASSLTDDTRYVTDLSCWGEQWDEFLHQLEGSQQ